MRTAKIIIGCIVLLLVAIAPFKGMADMTGATPEVVVSGVVALIACAFVWSVVFPSKKKPDKQ